MDFRALNTVTIANSFPVPCMGEVLMDLAGAKYFSSLDAAQAFHNIPIKRESQALTAFITAFRTYKFERMLFGLKNAGAMYCCLVKQLLDCLKLDGKVLAYLDDILVTCGQRRSTWKCLTRCWRPTPTLASSLRPRRRSC